MSSLIVAIVLSNVPLPLMLSWASLGPSIEKFIVRFFILAILFRFSSVSRVPLSFIITDMPFPDMYSIMSVVSFLMKGSPPDR